MYNKNFIFEEVDMLKAVVRRNCISVHLIFVYLSQIKADPDSKQGGGGSLIKRRR
jgi:hypothetical protein